MSEGLGGGGAQPNRVVGPNKRDVKPKSYSMNRPCLEHVELQRNLDSVKIGFVSSLKNTSLEYYLEKKHGRYGLKYHILFYPFRGCTVANF